MKTFKKPRYRLAIYEYSVLFFLLLMLSAAPTLAIKKGEDSSVSSPDGMVLIPGGAFSAGLDKDVGFQECKKYINKCKRFWFAKEEPRHEVFLEPFFMDKYEAPLVAVKRYSTGPLGSLPVVAVIVISALLTATGANLHRQAHLATGRIAAFDHALAFVLEFIHC